jgi:hypothetical protein
MTDNETEDKNVVVGEDHSTSEIPNLEAEKAGDGKNANGEQEDGEQKLSKNQLKKMAKGKVRIEWMLKPHLNKGI